jgi:hypothetical protein
MIKRYDQFINEEEGFFKNIVITLATILSLGLSKSDAQEIKNDQAKLAIIDTCAKYNKNPVGVDKLKFYLVDKVKTPEIFIQNYMEIQPDNTVILKPSFINGFKLQVNPLTKWAGFTYILNF